MPMPRSRFDKHALAFGGACGLSLLLAGPVQAQSTAVGDAASTVAAGASRSVAAAKRPGRARPAGAQAYVYHDTSQGDNLWDIAGAVVGPNPGIDRNQAMVAIFRANPGAFPEGNLHRIQKGLDLTVPSLAQIRAESRPSAAALVAQHRKAYADRRVVPLRLSAVAGDVASAAAAASVGADEQPVAASFGATSAGELEPPRSSGNGLPWWWGAWVSVAAVLVLALLRAWWRRPLALDLGLEPGAEPLALEAERAAEAAADERRADKAVASLYSETLAQPLDADVPEDEVSVAELAEGAGSEASVAGSAAIEPHPQADPPALADASLGLPVDEPAAPALPAAALAGALGLAYLEVDRPQAAKPWQGRSSSPDSEP